MPRFDVGDQDRGLVVPGLYGQMLKRERDEAERDDRAVARMLAEWGYCFRSPRFLLEALEAGKPVIVRKRAAEVACDFRFELPWDRSVRSVHVSPDDVVRPTDEPHPWYGKAADDPITGRAVDGFMPSAQEHQEGCT